MRPLPIDATRRFDRPFAAAFAAAVMAGVTCSASAQLAREVEGQRITGDSIVIDNDYPVRARQSVAGRVYSSDGELSVGVVRNLRFAPLFDPRTAYSRHNRFDRSDRWLAREIILGRVDPFEDNKSIGIVRAYRNNPYVDVRETQPGVLVFTNPNAGNGSSSPLSDGSPIGVSTSDISATVRTFGDLHKSVQNDPWALLNEGFYRDARRLFDEVAEPTNDSRTGVALAAALLGDFERAAASMPSRASLPDDVTLTDATQARIRQFRESFFQDNEMMQDALGMLISDESSSDPATMK